MRVRLKRNAFLNDSFCEAGSVVTVADDTTLAPYMTRLSDDPTPTATVAAVLPTVVAPANTVTVHYNEKSGEVDIDVNGVEMRVDHAALKVKVD
jgi:hypothetical protein